MAEQAKPVFRFAPSPNGRLHLGHALSALLTYQLADLHGGRVLLRIEDIDTGRTRPEFVKAIFEDLDWLGLTWEEPVLFQSERYEAYRAAAARLERLGLTYPCVATRSEMAASLDQTRTDPDGAPLYAPVCGFPRAPGTRPPCLETGRQAAVRLDTTSALRLAGAPLQFRDWNGHETIAPRTADPAIWGDPVIVRKDTPTSYHLAVVVDDAFQGVTHVTRGQDLERATDLHVLLQRLLDLPTPIYHHHHLIRDAEGRKLSKSARDTALADLRAAGTTPAEIRRLVGLD